MRVMSTTVHGTTLEWDNGEITQVPLVGPRLSQLAESEQELVHSAARDEATRWHELARKLGLISVSQAWGATVWCDGADQVTGDHLIATIKLLRSVSSEAGRIAVVAGDTRIATHHDYDSVGAMAAAVIRMRVDQWVGVGLAVKALSTQVGLEGSWDGESLWWELPGDAYDYLRAWPNPNDVVLVSGDSSSEIRAIMELIEADIA